MKYKKGMCLVDKATGKLIVLKRPNGKHWDCKCSGGNHKIHEGTLAKFYKLI